MAARSVSYVKAHLAEVLDAVRESHEPMVITQSGEGTAVLLDLQSYERGRRALAMLKLVAMGEADIAQGRVSGPQEVFARLKRRLKGKARAR